MRSRDLPGEISDLGVGKRGQELWSALIPDPRETLTVAKTNTSSARSGDATAKPSSALESQVTAQGR